jgi:hypothetical protein
LVKYLLVKTAILRLMPHINAAKNIALLAVAINQRGKTIYVVLQSTTFLGLIPRQLAAG